MSSSIVGLLVALAGGGLGSASAAAAVAQSPVTSAGADIKWHAPSQTSVSNLTEALHGSGVFGFIFNSSATPDDEYGIYNWCNMPHVRRSEYLQPKPEFELRFVELIHRHHKRTPYASNAFPVEPYPWDCHDARVFHYGQPAGRPEPARVYHEASMSPVNPFRPSGWTGSCAFPQITAQGLLDSWQHGVDLYHVYHGLLGLLPARDADFRSAVRYRVTNNVITSQVAGMVISGMWQTTDPFPLIVQPEGVDSLEPQYNCRAASSWFNAIKSGSNPQWQQHLEASADLFRTLDDISGVRPNDTGFHASFDHYYDNLSARQCHAKPLPCRLVGGFNSSTCVTQGLADAVYRMGNWEYGHIYRHHPASLAASAASLGVWVGELTTHLRDFMAGSTDVVYYHNVAHDGSLSRLLSILQLDEMVWPGMGAEVVFELYKRRAGQKLQQSQPTSNYYLRVLFGGRPLKSSNPTLGSMDMTPIETVLEYLDGLVGTGADMVKSWCQE
ncbi:Histidine acid phosphatase family protein [Hirsutella rhossiliensis]|uniref:Histidine acid phosphatase family protein n=1 Tax=Hirsutella rhossiliensis TaxID=111463 RepID=A0A9P8MT02_9HYPO|nr:Histidine acid phosphatase family protein [Hirsutella rhossiliensis]KAH0960690.1 Histidine acid phosphatase family protein [Hirsutella rhossiliensis]